MAKNCARNPSIKEGTPPVTFSAPFILKESADRMHKAAAVTPQETTVSEGRSSTPAGPGLGERGLGWGWGREARAGSGEKAQEFAPIQPPVWEGSRWHAGAGGGLRALLFHLPCLAPTCLLYASPGVSLCGCPTSGQVVLPVWASPSSRERGVSLTISPGGDGWLLPPRARPDVRDSSSLLQQFHPFSVPPICSARCLVPLADS